MRLRALWTGTVIAVALHGAPALADVKTGVEYWSRGDYDAAIREWQAPAAKGDADALFNLGQAYKLGRGVPKDLGKAEDMYRRAARQGHVRAADNYGVLLFQTNRQTDAMPWLNASAERGEPRAMYILAIATFNGDYAPKDWVRAYALMTRAASVGLAQAITSLSSMNEAIPLEQRQMGVSLAQDLEKQAAQVRARELGAADLGAKPVPAVSSAAQAKTLPARAPTAANALPRVDLPPSQTDTNGPIMAGPITAGADYANPVTLPRMGTGASAKTAAPKPVAIKPPVPRPTAIPAPTDAWRVQLGAFATKANADALWAKVRGRAELAGHRRIDVGTGITRLQAGGFASQAEANRACEALKGAGQTCLVTRP